MLVDLAVMLADSGEAVSDLVQRELESRRLVNSHVASTLSGGLVANLSSLTNGVKPTSAKTRPS